MPRLVFSLFVTGLVLGCGPCMLSCGPLLGSYIAATKDSARSGLRTYAIFSLTRLLVYIIFGILVGLFGEWVLHRFFESRVLGVLFFLFGLFLVIVGFFLIVEKLSVVEKCRPFIHQLLGKKDTKNIIIFGLIVSFSPCLPLLAVLGYITLVSDNWIKGILYMAAFGLGTLLSPMIVLSLFAGWLNKVLKRRQRLFRILRVACGLVLLYLGVQLMVNIQFVF